MSLRLWISITGALAALALCGLATSCTEPNPAYDPDPLLAGECRSGTEVTETFSAFGRPEKLDLLFIVDTSGDVDGLQEVLANSVSRYGELLRMAEIDARAAVATTNASGEVQLAGPGVSAAGCESNDTVVSDVDGSTFADELRCNLLLGARDRAFDQPLMVLDRLLAAGTGTEFFRSDARLMVVVATKDDDCSSEEELSGSPGDGCTAEDRELVEVPELVARWREDREATDELALVAIAGPPSGVSADEARPVCSSTLGSVYPANRLYRATQLFGDQGFFASACTDDVFGPLATAFDSFVSRSTVTLCPNSVVVQEPLSVLASNEDGEEAVQFGSDGFVFMGSTDDCPQGAIRFAGDALRGADEVEIDYCTIAAPQ